jgi:hypothetical protein
MEGFKTAFCHRLGTPLPPLNFKRIRGHLDGRTFIYLCDLLPPALMLGDRSIAGPLRLVLRCPMASLREVKQVSSEVHSAPSKSQSKFKQIQVNCTFEFGTTL